MYVSAPVSEACSCSAVCGTSLPTLQRLFSASPGSLEWRAAIIPGEAGSGVYTDANTVARDSPRKDFGFSAGVGTGVLARRAGGLSGAHTPPSYLTSTVAPASVNFFLMVSAS